MRKLFTFSLLFTTAFAFSFHFPFFSSKKEEKKQTKVLNGAGATFPYPVYTTWAKEYYKETGVKVNYQGIGSGGGQKMIKNRLVDFAGSDQMISPETLRKWHVLQYPGVIGSIVVVYNIPGIEDMQLKLPNDVVADIFLGKIKYWDDPRIKAANPNLNLPHMKITIVHRSEGSGTTWNFSYWLSQISPEWKEKIGYGKVVNWPTGIGAKGNFGVAAYIQQIPGAIGYVEYAYKLKNNLKAAQLQSAQKTFVKPTLESFVAAAKNARWDGSNDFYIPSNLILSPGKDSWPLTVATMILIPEEKVQKDKEVNKFFLWAFEKGKEDAINLGYVPLDENTVGKVKVYWKKHNVYPEK